MCPVVNGGIIHISNGQIPQKWEVNILVSPLFVNTARLLYRRYHSTGLPPLSLTAWQEECLRLPHVLAGGNLLYCLPTSGGKTLVAEVLILRQLLLRQRDVLLVLPYVSIVQEKVLYVYMAY